jgi:polyisoprenyl-phosphate glycosyltransferase
MADARSPLEPLLPLPFPLRRRAEGERKVTVVIPVFNEDDVLPQTRAQVSAVLAAQDIDWSIVFVNDGSTDGTAALLESFYCDDPRIAYITLSRNFGHQAAVSAGLDHVRAGAAVTMDADLQHPPHVIPAMIAAWREGYDVVHTRKQSTEGLPLVHRLVASASYWLVRRVAQVPIIAHASDFRLLDAKVLGALAALPERNRLYRGLASWVGFRQCVVPFVAERRAAGRSTYTILQRLNLVARQLFDFSSLPLHLGLIFGGTAIVLSMLYLVFILLWYFFGEDAPPGWASLISVTLVLNSITLGFLGIIGAYVSRIYNEVRGRPTYIVSHIRDHGDGADSGT